jgi:hypothetical protein
MMDSMTLLFVIGIGLLALGLGAIELGISKKGKNFLKLGGIGLVAWAVLSWSGISLVGEEGPPPSSVAEDFTVTATESLAQLTVDSAGQTITWAAQYNYTSAAFISNTQYFQVVFTVERGLGTVGLVQTSGDVVSVPSVYNSTTGQDYPLLTKTGDQYNAIWTRADATTSYELVTITIGEAVDGVAVTLNMTLSGGAVGSMDLYDSQTITLSIGSQTWTVQVLLAVAT